MFRRHAIRLSLGLNPVEFNRSTYEAMDTEALAKALYKKDREVLDLKRIHELTIMRLEENHRRKILDWQERGLYFEDAVNRITLDHVTNTDKTVREVTAHADQAGNDFISQMMLTVVMTIVSCWYLFYSYSTDPQRMIRPRDEFDLIIDSGPNGTATIVREFTKGNPNL